MRLVIGQTTVQLHKYFPGVILTNIVFFPEMRETKQTAEEYVM